MGPDTPELLPHFTRKPGNAVIVELRRYGSLLKLLRSLNLLKLSPIYTLILHLELNGIRPLDHRYLPTEDRGNLLIGDVLAPKHLGQRLRRRNRPDFPSSGRRFTSGVSLGLVSLSRQTSRSMSSRFATSLSQIAAGISPIRWPISMRRRSALSPKQQSIFSPRRKHAIKAPWHPW